MPFYEYVCTHCGKSTTILQKISDPPATDCPACNTPNLTKQISAAGFRLKGGGWYETDFKSGSDTKRNLAGEGSTGSSASAKADTATPAPAAATPPTTTTP
jgi:putative FmdB family regulatory protein